MKANGAVDIQPAEDVAAVTEPPEQPAGDAENAPAAESSTEAAPPAPRASSIPLRIARRVRSFRLRSSRLRSAALLVVIIVTGSTAIWAHSCARAVHAASASRNAALTDVATTAAVKSQVTRSVEALFSFDFSDPAKTDGAASASLTGAAVGQYASLMQPVRSRAAALKLVLTTTVTSAGVQTLQGDRARVLIFADQSDTSTASAATSESSVAFAVDAQLVGGTWRIAGIDTLGA